MESYEEKKIKWLIDKPRGLLLTRRRLEPTPSRSNNRMVMNFNGVVDQVNNYYPSGLTMAESPARGDQAVQPYKFENKELDRFKGLDFYDFKARQFSPDIPRFWSPDPLAWKRPWESQYCAFGNNPVNRVDPTGMDYYIFTSDGRTVLALKNDDKTDRLFATKKSKEGGEYVDTKNTLDVNDKELLPQLAGGKDFAEAKTSNSADAFGVFKFAADNSNVEWSLSGYKDGGQTNFYLNTKYNKGTAETGESNGIFEAKDMLFNVHSHWEKDGSKGGSGYLYNFNIKENKWYVSGYQPANGGGSDGEPAAELHKKTGRVMPMYVYHRYTQGLYKYDPWNPASKSWLNINSGRRMRNIIYP